MKLTFLLLALLPAGLWAVTVAAPPYTFELDESFPSLRAVTRAGVSLSFAASPGTSALLRDGQPVAAVVRMAREDASTVRYNFESEGGTVVFRVQAQTDGLTFDCEKATPRAGTLTLTGTGISTANSAARYIWTRMRPMTDSLDHTGALAGGEPFSECCNYAALWTPVGGAMLLSNALNERARVCVSGGAGRLSLDTPAFTLADDLPLPSQRLVLAPADSELPAEDGWQAVARTARPYLSRPFGAERTRTTVTSQIAINFANLTQNPFLRVLDAVKRAALATDGLPQELLLKGYQGGGHDSSHPDYAAENRQAGGFGEMNLLVARAKDYNVSVGVHVNCTEAYPESRWFAAPYVTRQNAWRWLDQARKIDKEADIRSGALFGRLDELQAVAPELGFVYVDAYQDVGYAPRKIAGKLASMNLRMWTEFDTAMDPYAVASHGRGRIKGRLVRFLWNADRDIFRHDPLLPAANHDGFLGWDNERDFRRFVRDAFTRCLPAKVLQNFELLRWTEARAEFDGPVSSRAPDGTVSIIHEGLELYRCAPDGKVTVALPWPARAPARLYLRADAPARVEGLLPKTLAGQPLRLWRVTDLGREELPLPDGALKEERLALSLPAGEVWVLDANPSSLPAPQWGEGTPLRDPGFDSHGLSDWNALPSDSAVPGDATAPSPKAQVAPDRSGNPRLLLSGGGAVRQTSAELPAGTYDVSAWASVRGNLTLTAAAPSGGGRAEFFGGVPNRDNSACGGSARYGTDWQRLRARVTLATPASLTITLQGSDAEVDDVRIVRVVPAPLPEGALWAENFECCDQGWGPFVYAVPKGGGIRTHLSEANPLDRSLTPDVLNGRFSLKTWGEPVGPVLRTHSGLLALPSGRRLSLTAETSLDKAGYAMHLCARDGAVLTSQELPEGRKTFCFTFETPAEPGAYLRLDRCSKDAGMLLLDDLLLISATE